MKADWIKPYEVIDYLPNFVLPRGIVVNTFDYRRFLSRNP